MLFFHSGATALLAVTSSQVLRIHFYYIPMVMISSIIMVNPSPLELLIPSSRILSDIAFFSAHRRPHQH